VSSDPKEVQDLFDRIAGCLSQAVKLNAIAFRSAGVKYANEKDFTSGGGASYYGGRWNPPGVAAIYASLDPATAVKESYQEFIKYGFKPGNMRPRVFAGLKLNVNRVSDLTDAKIRKKLGSSRRGDFSEKSCVAKYSRGVGKGQATAPPNKISNLVCNFACIFACNFSSRSL
jgi:RES domain-containing protein